MEQFFFALHDCPEAVGKLCQRMRHFYDRMLQVAADSPAEVVLFGANYDDSITYPPFYRKYILPELRAYGICCTVRASSWPPTPMARTGSCCQSIWRAISTWRILYVRTR